MSHAAHNLILRLVPTALLFAAVASAEPLGVLPEDAFAVAPPLDPVLPFVDAPAEPSAVPVEPVPPKPRSQMPVPAAEPAPPYLPAYVPAPAPIESVGPAYELTLRPEAFVRGPDVLLGDIAEIRGDAAGRLARLSLGPAAAPGGSKRLQAGIVAARVASAGFTTDDFTLVGARAVTATTLHREISREVIAESLREYVLAVMPWAPADAEVSITPPSQELVLPDGEVAIDWQPNPQYQFIGSGAFRGTVLVDGEAREQVLCRADIEAYVDVVVVASDVSRGRILGPNDLALEKRALSQMKPGAFRTREEVLGLVAQSTLFPGTVLTQRQVAAPILVKRHQLVNVVLRTGALVVNTQARAQSDARAGDMVALVADQSKESFFGRVQPDGTVVLE